MLRRFCLFALAMCCLPLAHGASIASSYSQLAGSTWTVDLTVTNDGAPIEITGFTVFFPELSFKDLVIDTSPGDWDSIVIQPDLALSSAGFFDTFVVSAPALTIGQSQDGFRIQFTYLDAGRPPMLPFDIVNESFQIVSSGLTVAAPTNPIPEPATWLLAGMGLMVCVARCRWQLHTRSTQPQRS